ncbi:heat-inducible transcription repressor HrcA [Staphylococcus massiliensis CCUG 55927]|uniref:heat-inducible transcriptional repressor HrcA n=1 Tax=Staphylococcus massiliensis TaxID=555791 RepID=UPI00031CB00B|nr:heat-inducible transcriptional repressor HrcA [Staphylococcus massiliensis]PNZ98921.1 heat-inducible transcription repressor HrcA [Staphylococcus massiliensis CCUG 55927]
MITKRQFRILNAVVEDYVDLGQPIGSKSLIERHGVNVSPATIRNDMKRLEEMSLIEKTHTSSGRVPSNLGFRFYVNHILDQHSFQNNERLNHISDMLVNNHYDMTSTLNEFANEISSMSEYTTLVVGPNHSEHQINTVHLIKATEHHLVMVVVFNTGHVDHLHLSTPDSYSTDDLIMLSNYITNEIQTRNEVGMRDDFDATSYQKLIQQINTLIKTEISNNAYGVFMGGKVKLIDALNESNVSSIQPILQYIESNQIMSLIDHMNDARINVKIGKEIDEGLDEISIIISDYHIDDESKGHIAVIGPTAMRYHDVIQLLGRIW